jgi:hypothetical protein
VNELLFTHALTNRVLQRVSLPLHCDHIRSLAPYPTIGAQSDEDWALRSYWLLANAPGDDTGCVWSVQPIGHAPY